MAIWEGQNRSDLNVRSDQIKEGEMPYVLRMV